MNVFPTATLPVGNIFNGVRSSNACSISVGVRSKFVNVSCSSTMVLLPEDLCAIGVSVTSTGAKGSPEVRNRSSSYTETKTKGQKMLNQRANKLSAFQICPGPNFIPLLKGE